MLGLTGLMGIIGASAASLILPQSESEDEATDSNTAHRDSIDTLNGQENRLPFSENLHPPNSDEDALFFSSVDHAMHTDDAPFDPPENPDAARDDGGLYEFSPGSDEGASDTAPDGEYETFVALGDWISAGTPGEEIDYHPATERLMLVWDDLEDGATEPQVRVEHDLFDPDAMHVVMNEKSVAEVHGDPSLSAADLTVIPLSSALIVGLEPA